MVYIYALVCPETGEIRYIGKTKNIEARLAAHISKAKSFQTNNHCANWIRSLLIKTTAPKIRVVKELSEHEDWQRAESCTIAAYRAAGHKLTNSTSGGDGFHDMPPEVIAKSAATRRKTLSDPVRRAAFVRATSVRKNDPEVRKKQSEALIARWNNPIIRALMVAGMNTPEAIAHKSEASKSLHAKPGYAANHSAKMKEAWSAPERREEASRRSLKAWSDHGIRARRVAAINATVSTPEYKARMRVINSEINSRPEVKEKKSIKSKAYAADPARFFTRLAAMQSPEVRAKMSAAAKRRFLTPESKAYLSTPEARARVSESAKRRATPEYRAMMAEKTRQSWEKRRNK